MSFSSALQDASLVGLVVGWDDAAVAHRVVDLENGKQFHVGERSFESDPWWREIK